jgi:diguanylate cyclase (GGDEF)-like protein
MSRSGGDEGPTGGALARHRPDERDGEREEGETMVMTSGGVGRQTGAGTAGPSSGAGTPRDTARDTARDTGARPGSDPERGAGLDAVGDRRLFSTHERRAGLVWVALTIPAAAALGLVVQGERAYLLAWVLIGALNLLPAVALSFTAWRRATDADKRFWKLITIGVASMATIGLIVLFGVLRSNWYGVVVAVPLAAMCVAVFFTALFDLVRARCTIPVHPLDILESAMLVLAVCAFAPLAWGARPIVMTTLWFTSVALIATVGVLAGFCWSLAMFRRVKGQRLPDETLGMAIGFLCGVNAAAQTAQGLTGFELPSSPLLVLQALCFGVVLIMPLQLTDNAPSAYDTLPLLEQTRARSFDTVAITLLIPMLILTVVRQADAGWTVWYFVGVASALLLLALLRGKLSMRETRRLYAQVEHAADARRQLLADVLQSADHDRHRVAAQLHQQATGFYVAFTSFLRLTDDGAANPALRGMRDDLEHRADELRELMLAVRPLETDQSGTADLEATLAAYIDSLYVDTAAPQVDIQVDEGLALDWTTETIAMRILQEALRNVAKHSRAKHVIVTIDEHEAGVALRVLDDGVGFDAKHLLFESGNDYMRKFASHLDGHVYIESEPGRGTSVKAVLGVPGGAPSEPPPRPAPDVRRPHLRLVATDDRADDGVDIDLPGDDRDATDVADPAPNGVAERRSEEATTGEAPSEEPSEPLSEVDSPWHRAQASVQGFHARLAQRRAASDGRRFLYFRSTASQSVVREVIEVGLAALLLLPLAIVSGLAIAPRADSAWWLLLSVALATVVVITTAYDMWMFRRQAWDRFDPRAFFAKLVVGMLAVGAFGVATGGEVALFGMGLVIILLVAVLAGSPAMVGLLWGIGVAVLTGVLLLTGAPTPMAWWIAGFFASGTALIAGIVHLTVWKARDGLLSLEDVAEFASYACTVRHWESEKHEVLQRVAAAVDATTVLVFERPHDHGQHLRELARWTGGRELSPFLESDLRLLAARAHPDGEFEVTKAGHERSHLLSIAASTTTADIVLAVQLERMGPRDDAALIAAVSMLASAIDRSSLIDGLLGEALTDPLTGLANRRQLQDHLAHAVGRAGRSDEAVSIAMLDLDEFKRFNDTWGHAAGDRVLLSFAHQLRGRLRTQDVASRYGGEEFCLLLPNTTAAAAKVLLDDLQRTLDGFEDQPVTFSAGVAQLQAHESADDLVARADAAMYAAKAAGRRQTCLAPDAVSTDRPTASVD